jgi:PhnB protein
MTRINPYLNFNGNCREAMSFYRDCLGGELALQTVDGTPMANRMPVQMRQLILHACLYRDGFVLMGSDMTREELIDGNTVQLCLNCGSEEELQNCFDKLSSGGTVQDPLTEMFWGATYGALTDRYGKSWVLNWQRETEQCQPGTETETETQTLKRLL